MKPEDSLSNKQTLSAYKKAITRQIRSTMALKGKTYDDLVTDLNNMGLHLNSNNLRSKLSKGSMSADLFVAIMHALNSNEDTIAQIIRELEGV